MLDVANLKFPSAQRAYMAANSPGYFLRKLRSDPDVARIAATEDGASLVAAIKSCLAQEPADLRELVVAYALTAALAVKGPRSRLEEVASTACPYHEWLPAIVERLVGSWKSSIILSGSLTNISRSTETFKSSIASTERKFEVFRK